MAVRHFGDLPAQSAHTAAGRSSSVIVVRECCVRPIYCSALIVQCRVLMPSLGRWVRNCFCCMSSMRRGRRSTPTVAAREPALSSMRMRASSRDRAMVPKSRFVQVVRIKIIADVAIKWDADLIVLGPYRRRFGDSFRGTTAERVIRIADRPVLVVNRDSADPYEHVLLAADLSRMSIGIAHVTKELGLLEGARASVVHALQHTRGAMPYLAGVERV